MPAPRQVVPQLLQEVAAARARSIDGGGSTRLVTLESGDGVGLYRAGAGPTLDRGRGGRWIFQRLGRRPGEGAGDVRAVCHAHDPEEVPIPGHRPVGRVTGEEFAAERWVGGVAVGVGGDRAAAWLGLAGYVVVGVAVDVHVTGVDAQHHLG